MKLLKLCRNIIIRLLVAMVIISSLSVSPVFCLETEDSQVFIAGFNAYQQKDYATSIEKMSEVLQKHPDSPLRDMALFWLSRSYFKAGNQQEAARYLSQFTKEYPDNPLRSTAEDELLALTARYEKGEKLPIGSPPVKQPDRLAAQKAKAEKERIAANKAEEAKRAATAAESARTAALKQAEENVAIEKRELARVAAAKAEQERIAAAKVAEEKRVAAESARVAALKQAEEKAAVERKEQERRAAVQAEQERAAQEAAARSKIEQQKIVAIKAEEERLAAEQIERAAKLEKEKLAVAAKAEQDRLAAARSEELLRTEAAAENARIAAQKAERERITLARAEEARLAAAAAESARQASLKAEEERKSAERAVNEEKNSRLAILRAEEGRLAQQKIAEESARSVKLAYREKAIGQYKKIIDTFPVTPAAAAAAVKLRELGVAVALPPRIVEPPLPENSQVLRLEVAQFVGFEFNLLARPEAFTVGQPLSVPFEIINRGNGSDSFSLESGFPADFKARFTAAPTPAIAIDRTPSLASGETFRGTLSLVIPAVSIDGLRITHPVKAASRLNKEASQSREVRLVASAPLLRAVLRTEKNRPLPGDRITYHIAVLNVGSAVAQDVSVRLTFPPQLDPADVAAAGFRQYMKSALVLDGLRVNSGESREFTVTFQLKNDSLAGQELTARAELINNQLKTSAAFISNVAYVEAQRSISVRTGSDRVVAIPGQTVSVPFVVTNTGNIREKFKIASVVTGAQDAVIFNDLNRDGIRQAGEPVINEIGPLAPGEEANVVAELKIPNNAADAGQGSIRVSFVSDGDSTRSASGTTQLVYSRPVLKMVMSGRDGLLKPGDVASFDLSITNNGSNLARIVELQSTWPEQLELIAADPATSAVGDAKIVWRFRELGAGEKRSIKVSFRVKPGTGVGTAIQVKNILTYEDQLGNRY